MHYITVLDGVHCIRVYCQRSCVLVQVVQ